MSMIERKTIVLEEGLDILQKGITKIKNILEGLPEPQFTPEYSMILYTTIYNMCNQRCPHNYGRQLHGKYKEAFEEYIISTVLPSLQEKKDELLLRELLRRWSNHKIMTRCLSRFFGYIDRCSDIRSLKLPSLEETSFLSFYYLVYEEMNKQVLDAILAMADQKRAGEQIDQTLLINALDFCLDFEERARKNNARVISEEKMHGSPTISSKKINLISSDGDVFEVDYGVALMSKTFEDTIKTIPVGDVGSISVYLVNSKMLTKVIEYCKKHNNAQMDVDLRDWDAQFIDVDRTTLFKLDESARFLKIDSLRELIGSKLDSEFVDLIRGKTPEELKQLLASKRAQNSKSQEEDNQHCHEIFS